MNNSISHTETVNASIEVVWKHLLFKIDHPQSFFSYVSHVEILEKTIDFTRRKMQINFPDKTLVLIEKIIASPYLVRFEIIEHANLTGYVENQAIKIDDETTKLTYTMNWKNKEDHTSANNIEGLKSAVMMSKKYIEESF